jgi:hypothetical protein
VTIEGERQCIFLKTKNKWKAIGDHQKYIGFDERESSCSIKIV